MQQLNWWGKIIGGGFGFMLGGPLGALLAAALGHQLDKNLVVTLDVGAGQTQRTQAAFFTAIFAVMGYVAKVDGKISKDEIGIAEQLMAQMRLSADQPFNRQLDPPEELLGGKNRRRAEDEKRAGHLWPDHPGDHRGSYESGMAGYLYLGTQ